MKNADKPASPVMIDDWHGLTKREMFAMHAMQGLMPDFQGEGASVFEIAQVAVKAADALLKELDQ